MARYLFLFVLILIALAGAFKSNLRAINLRAQFLACFTFWKFGADANVQGNAPNC